MTTERKTRNPNDGPQSPRGGSENLALGYVGRGVKTVAVRFAPSVHGNGDPGFLATLVDVARQKCVAGYIGNGTNRWSAVHLSDATRVVRSGSKRLRQARSCTPSANQASQAKRSPKTSTLVECVLSWLRSQTGKQSLPDLQDRVIRKRVERVACTAATSTRASRGQTHAAGR